MGFRMATANKGIQAVKAMYKSIFQQEVEGPIDGWRLD